VKEKFPAEYKSRDQDKLRYRYPRGESYMDVISRWVGAWVPGQQDKVRRF
jgi:broad specificity phosphatase PhoE